MIAIQTKNLTKKFEEQIAVDSLNLSIEQGELFTLLGVNGAGKTTTIKMLTCLSTPTTGDASILGNSIVSNPYAVKEQINVSPQETAVAPNLSVKENLELIAQIYGFHKTTIDIKVEEMLRTFSLTEVSKMKAKTLSGGCKEDLVLQWHSLQTPKSFFLMNLLLVLMSSQGVSYGVLLRN